MDLNVFCSIALALSIATMAFAILIGIKSYRTEYKGKGDALYKRHFILTPFQVFLICFFIGTVFIFIPIYYTDYFSQEMQFARIFKSIFLSVHNTMRLFILDGDFDIIEKAVTDPNRVHYAIGNAYSVYASILFVIAPVMTASFVLSFFKNVSSYIKYTFSFSSRIYYISELNEKSIALATNILSESGIRKPLIVFFDVFENNDEASCELIDQAKRLGAVCFQKDITEIGLKYYHLHAERKFYFIGENEDENIKQALTLIKHCRESSRYNVPTTQFYVFSTTVDSEVLLDSVDNGNMKVRRINENRNLVVSTLLNKPIFQKYIEDNDEKKVNVLIVGGGNYGVELIKAISWCGQIPNYKVSIHVVDKSDELESYFSSVAPELMKNNKKRESGEPYYEITFYPNIDVYGKKFPELLTQIDNITTAFITLGDDEANVDIAMRLRRECGRLQLKCKYTIPNIYSVVYSTLKTQTLLQNGGLLCLGKDDYGIQFIGDIRTRYSLSVIEQLDLEAQGMCIHLSWLEHRKQEIRRAQEDETEINALIEESKLSYDKYEYYRRASIAAAVYKYVITDNKIAFESTEIEKEFEHKRWNAFMRAEGYVFDPEEKNHIAKTHPDLKPYKNLTALEKEKDILVDINK